MKRLYPDNFEDLNEEEKTKLAFTCFTRIKKRRQIRELKKSKKCAVVKKEDCDQNIQINDQANLNDLQTV